MSNDLWVSKRDRSASCDVNIAKDSHILIGRRRVPVHPRPCQIVCLSRKDLYGYCIYSAQPGYVADVQLMNAKCARYFIRPGNPLTVQPDIRAKIYALELKPYLMSAINWRKTKLSSIPPGVAKRTILRHRKV